MLIEVINATQVKPGDKLLYINNTTPFEVTALEVSSSKGQVFNIVTNRFWWTLMPGERVIKIIKN